MKFGCWFRIPFTLAFLLTVPVRSWPESAGDISTKPFLVSFPIVKLGKAERIGSFNCTIRPARILSLREFPDEWQITVQNGDSETATIEGQMLVGTGAFSASDNYFTRFMTVELPNPSPIEPQLYIGVEMQIITDQTFVHYRYVHFNAKQIKLEEIH
jgi:hypothetical protein